MTWKDFENMPAFTRAELRSMYASYIVEGCNQEAFLLRSDWPYAWTMQMLGLLRFQYDVLESRNNYRMDPKTEKWIPQELLELMD